jgi:hypothetical protein
MNASVPQIKIPKRVRLALTRVLGDTTLPSGAVSLVTDILVTGIVPSRKDVFARISFPRDICFATFRIRELLLQVDDRRYYASPWAAKCVRSSLDQLEIYIDSQDF